MIARNEAIQREKGPKKDPGYKRKTGRGGRRRRREKMEEKENKSRDAYAGYGKIAGLITGVSPMTARMSQQIRFGSLN